MPIMPIIRDSRGDSLFLNSSGCLESLQEYPFGVSIHSRMCVAAQMIDSGLRPILETTSFIAAFAQL